MEVDHTNSVEKNIETIIVKVLDSCAFYAPKDGSLVAVKLCAFCKFSDFEKNQHTGTCHYHFDSKGRKTNEL